MSVFVYFCVNLNYMLGCLCFCWFKSVLYLFLYIYLSNYLYVILFVNCKFKLLFLLFFRILSNLASLRPFYSSYAPYHSSISATPGLPISCSQPWSLFAITTHPTRRFWSRSWAAFFSPTSSRSVINVSLRFLNCLYNVYRTCLYIVCMFLRGNFGTIIRLLFMMMMMLTCLVDNNLDITWKNMRHSHLVVAHQTWKILIQFGPWCSAGDEDKELALDLCSSRLLCAPAILFCCLYICEGMTVNCPVERQKANVCHCCRIVDIDGGQQHTTATLSISCDYGFVSACF